MRSEFDSSTKDNSRPKSAPITTSLRVEVKHNYMNTPNPELDPSETPNLNGFKWRRDSTTMPNTPRSPYEPYDIFTIQPSKRRNDVRQTPDNFTDTKGGHDTFQNGALFRSQSSRSSPIIDPRLSAAQGMGFRSNNSRSIEMQPLNSRLLTPTPSQPNPTTRRRRLEPIPFDQMPPMTITHWVLVAFVMSVGLILTISAAITLVINQDFDKMPRLATHSQQRAEAISSNDISNTVLKKVLMEVPLIDGHNDWLWNIRLFTNNQLKSVDLRKNLKTVEPWSKSPWSQTDIVRLKKGYVGAQFWAVYVACEAQYYNAVQLALEQIDLVKRLVTKYSDYLQMAATADGIEKAFSENKIASLISVEGGHLIGNSLAVLRIYYELGVRILTITHNCNTAWADSHIATREQLPVHKGLSEFGKQVIEEMNRLGMMVDLSHSSFDTMRDALATSIAPVIFSHSSAYALCNNTRNVPDPILRQLAQNGGIIMVTFFTPYLVCTDETVTISDVADHIEHIKKVIGVNHIGIGGDFDGINRLPIGLEDTSKYPNLFVELFVRGWSIEDLQKLAGLNFLRVFRQVEKIREKLFKVGMPPKEDLIPKAFITEFQNCTYNIDAVGHS